RYTSGVRHDYKDTEVGPRDRRRRRWTLFVLGLSLPPLGAVLLLLGTPHESAPPARTEAGVQPPAETPPAIVADTTALGLLQPLGPTPPVASPEPIIDPASTMLNLLVRPGDTLEVLFRRNGLCLSDLDAVALVLAATRAVKVSKPGDRLGIAHREGQVVSL